MEEVYRVQDSDGRGPFKPGFSRKWVEKNNPDHEDLPPWYVEFGPVHKKALYGEHVGCGCRTLDQLRRWFTASGYKKLLGYGYRCVRMEVDRILGESAIQCVFGRTRPLKEGVIGVALYDRSASSAIKKLPPDLKTKLDRCLQTEITTADGKKMVLLHTEPLGQGAKAELERHSYAELEEILFSYLQNPVVYDVT